MAVDSLELQLASALQRYHTLRRRAEAQKESPALLTRTLAELGTALEQLRVAQEQMFDARNRLHDLQAQLTDQRNRYWELFDQMPLPYARERAPLSAEANVKGDGSTLRWVLSRAGHPAADADAS